MQLKPVFKDFYFLRDFYDGSNTSILKAFLFQLLCLYWFWSYGNECGLAGRKYVVKRRFNSFNLNISPQL